MFIMITFVSVVRYLGQVDEAGSDHVSDHAVLVLQLEFDPPAERREHLAEHHLLVPLGVVTILLHGRLALQKLKSIFDDCCCRLEHIYGTSCLLMHIHDSFCYPTSLSISNLWYLVPSYAYS